MHSRHDEFRDAALAGIRAFQAVLNPPPVARHGLSYRFDIPPLSVFALDLRAVAAATRSPDPIMCSEAELAAFERWAAGLAGPGALVVGQPLWQGAGDWQDWNPPSFAAQYARIWKALTDAPLRHRRALGRRAPQPPVEIDVGGDRRVWELVSSPACHIPTVESIAARPSTCRTAAASASPGAPRGRRGPPRRLSHGAPGSPNTIALVKLTPVEDDGRRVLRAASSISSGRPSPRGTRHRRAARSPRAITRGASASRCSSCAAA
jgi:hypothetical protein